MAKADDELIQWRKPKQWRKRIVDGKPAWWRRLIIDGKPVWVHWPGDWSARASALPPKKKHKPVGPKRRKRHSPKSPRAIAVLKHLYPPRGRPSRKAVPDAQLERDYHAECVRRGIHPNDRVEHTQLLRCAGRKKT